jgi:transcriptional regulator with XRE-family HTH domain
MNLVRKRTLPRDAKPRPELAVFLRFLRRRIDPDVRDLGPYERYAGRLGKLVSQEELAEAIGVSREWYAALESAASPRTSTSLIDRLADVLMVTAEERGRLFRLVVPELRRMHLRDDSIAALEAFSCLRSLTKRLFAATSIEDVLTTAGEQIAEWFDDALLVRSTRRHESGLWECRNVDDKQDRSNVSKAILDKREVLLTSESFVAKDLLLTSRLFDTLNYHAQLTNAGDVGGPDLWPLPLRQELLTAQARHRFGVFAWRYARVRSGTGFTGGLAIAHESGHSHTASDIAVLGAVAEVASLALV